MRKMESEVEETQGPAVGSLCGCDHHNVEEEARMIMAHGQMGPSGGEMDMDMKQDMPMRMGEM